MKLPLFGQLSTHIHGETLRGKRVQKRKLSRGGNGSIKGKLMSTDSRV